MRVLITRPRSQADGLSTRIGSVPGASVVCMPTLEIADLDDSTLLGALLQRDIARYAWCGFMSTNAVHKVMATLASINRSPEIFKATSLIVMGPATERSLQQYGLEAALAPGSVAWNSEQLAQHPALQSIRGQSIVLFAAQEGRTFLYETLISRGAQVDQIFAYQQRCPQEDVSAVKAEIAAGQIDIAIVNSCKGLRHFVTLLGGLAFTVPLLVGSARVAEAVHSYPWLHPPLCADNASDEGLFERLMDWNNEQSHYAR